jgi:hypothetical protein
MFNIDILTNQLLQVYEQAIVDKQKNRSVNIVPPAAAAETIPVTQSTS